MFEIGKYLSFMEKEIIPRKKKANIKGNIVCCKCGNVNTTLYKIENDIYICSKCKKEQEK